VACQANRFFIFEEPTSSHPDKRENAGNRDTEPAFFLFSQTFGSRHGAPVTRELPRDVQLDPFFCCP
jgi:hypothetical protein